MGPIQIVTADVAEGKKMEMNRGGLIGPAEFAFLANRRIFTELFFFFPPSGKKFAL